MEGTQGCNGLWNALGLCHTEEDLSASPVATQHIHHTYMEIGSAVLLQSLKVIGCFLHVAPKQCHTGRIDDGLDTLGEQTCCQVYDVIIVITCVLMATRRGIEPFKSDGNATGRLSDERCLIVQTLHLGKYLLLRLNDAL